MWRGMLNLLGLIFLGDAFPYFSLICKDEKKNQILKCSSSADGSRDPSGPVGPNEEGSADPQPKCPHGTTKPPREQVWRKYQQLSRSYIQSSSTSNKGNYLDWNNRFTSHFHFHGRWNSCLCSKILCTEDKTEFPTQRQCQRNAKDFLFRAKLKVKAI